MIIIIRRLELLLIKLTSSKAKAKTTKNSMLLQSMTLSTKIVFSKWLYTALAGGIAGTFWIIFNSFDQLLFFFPVLTFYLPSDAILSFIISNITAVLLGIVISMNAYVFKNLKGLKMIGGASSLFSGSSLSIISSTCASCSSIGFLLISTFGGVGVTASAFLSNYQIPLRLISLLLLIWAYYSVTKMLTRSSSSSCIIK